MDRVVRQYCAQVGRHLQCMPKTKKILLAGLREELEQLPEECRSSLSRLEENYRSTIHTAIELQEAVKPEEQCRYTKVRKTALCSVLVVLIATVILSLGLSILTHKMLVREQSALTIVYQVVDPDEPITHVTFKTIYPEE